METVCLEIDDAKAIALKIKEHAERILSLPITAALKKQLDNDIKDIKALFQKADWKEVA